MHTKFPHNRPSRYRVVAGEAFMEKGVHTCAPPISAPYTPHTPHPTPIPNFTTIGPAATEKQRRKICDTLRAARATCHSRFFFSLCHLFFRRQQCLFFIIRSQSAGQYQCIHSNVAYPMTTLYLKFPCLHVINRPQKQNNTNTALTITITRHTYPTPKHLKN